jgi:hypothetical protein
MIEVDREDLKLCEELWDRNPLNQDASNPIPTPVDFESLFPIHNDSDQPQEMPPFAIKAPNKLRLLSSSNLHVTWIETSDMHCLTFLLPL